MLYSPIIDAKLPAFQYNDQDNSIVLEIPYKMNRSVGINDYDGFQLLIKTVSTGKEIFNISAQDYTENTAIFVIDNSVRKIRCNQFYKVQLAYVKNDTIGYFSSVGIIKCTNSAEMIILNLNENSDNKSLYTYQGVYMNEDFTEKVYNYYFNIYDEWDNIYETSGVLIHNADKDKNSKSSSDSWSPTKSLISNKNYYIEYGVKTVNGLNVTSSKYKISNGYSIAPPDECTARISAELHSDDGYVEVKFINEATGKFILSRSSNKDNFQTWVDIANIQVINHPSGLVIWKDFTIEQGVKYMYSIRLYNDNNVQSVHIASEECVVQADFEDMFLYDGERQLKIRFNPKVSSFKTTRLESKTDTIGGRYPHFFRNGNVAYKEFPISGLISFLSDENELFIKGLRPADPDRKKTAGNILDGRNLDNQLTVENFIDEREFKLEVLEWLSNGKPKLFRSPGEGNYIVRLMNVTLTPNDTLSRMIHTFNCTAYEIKECTFNALKDLKFLNVAVDQNYLTRYVNIGKLNENYTDFLHHDLRIFEHGKGSYSGSPLEGKIIITLPENVTETSRYGYKLVSNNLRKNLPNIKISGAVPFSQDFIFVKSDSNNKIEESPIADGEGIIKSDLEEIKYIIVENPFQLNLINVEYDSISSFEDVLWWDEWNQIEDIKIIGEKTEKCIYASKLYVKNASGDVSDNYIKYNNPGAGCLWIDENNSSFRLIDYLKYLKQDYQHIGEVYYLYIHYREDTLDSTEAANVGDAIIVKSYDKEIKPIPVQNKGIMYRDIGTLAELKCGNIYDVDIVFLEKETILKEE